MSIIRTRERSSEEEVNNFKLRPAGIVKAWPAAPLLVGLGTATQGVTTLNIDWATGTKKGDFGVIAVESSGAAVTATATGWTHFIGSPVVDVADATGSKLNILWKYAESDSPASASVSVSAADHTAGRMIVFRNVSTEQKWITATDTKTVASTTATWPSLSTASPNNMVVLIASRPDDNASTLVFSGFTAAGLTGAAEGGEAGTATGNGGGLVINYGTRAAMGSIGTSTATMTVSVTNALFVVALEPTIALPA